MPRLPWASTSSGRIFRASWNCSMASSNCPFLARVMPRLLWATIVRRRAGQGVRPERLVVAPGGRLQPGTCHEEGQYHRGGRGVGSKAGGPGSPGAGEHPSDAQERPDLRQVRIAVGHGLAADLDQPDHRHEHSQVPQPADEQSGSFRRQATAAAEIAASTSMAPKSFHPGTPPSGCGYIAASRVGQNIWPR